VAESLNVLQEVKLKNLHCSQHSIPILLIVMSEWGVVNTSAGGLRDNGWLSGEWRVNNGKVNE